jgi:hypothetical protein
VDLAGSTEHLGLQCRLARIEEERVDRFVHELLHLVERLGTGHVDDLHQLDSWQRMPQLLVRAVSQFVDDLDRVGAASALLRDDVGCRLKNS